jgi:uncharacterized Tic20 family protein
MAHLSGAFLVFLGPLSLWALRRMTSSFGNEALTICCDWYAFSSALILVLLGLAGEDIAVCGLAFNCVYGLVGAFASSRGRRFRYWKWSLWIH